MSNKFAIRSAIVAATLAVAAPVPAMATVIFTSTFEGAGNSDNSRTVAVDPGVLTPAGTYGLYTTADGWTATSANNPIELQNNVAGAPAPTGGKAFVELDSTRNSSMSRSIAAAGVYSLSWLYSPRPNQPSTTNGIQVLLNNVLFTPPGTLTAAGGGSTTWNTYSTNVFSANAGDVITFKAVGTSDSFGGYIDNITLTAVPEPATWAMMIGGFGLVGGAMRRRTVRTLSIA